MTGLLQEPARAGFTNLIKAPAAGVYADVPMETYHRWTGASNSRLTKLRRSPAHLKAALEEPPEETSALVMGRATHAAILEPDLFTARYACAPEGLDRRTKEGKATWERLLNQYGEGFVLKAADYDVCLKVRDAVHRHTSASTMLAADGRTELSLVWEDDETGLVCKARMDRHTAVVADGIVIDLKSTKDASKREFERAVHTYGYHRQGAHYLTGAQKNGLDAGHFVVIAFEKEPPFAAATYRLVDAAIEAGQHQLRPLIRDYARCLERDEWPAYPQYVQDIALPDYAWSQIDEEVTERGTNYDGDPI